MGTHLAQLTQPTTSAADLKPPRAAGPRQMLSRLGGRCWQIHGYPGGKLASFLFRGISVPHDWPRRPKQLFSVEPTKENLKFVDQIHRQRLQGERFRDSEDFLSQQLVKEMPHPLAQKFPYLYLYEWEVQWGPDAGRGDFVFASGDGHFAIVEVKHIDVLTSGKTVRRRRTKMRTRVWDQAHRYALLFRFAADKAGVQLKTVTAFTYTNEDGLIYVDQIIEEDPVEDYD